MKLLTVILAFSALIAFSSCGVCKKSCTSKGKTSQEAVVKSQEDDCPDDLMCTMDYRMIILSIKDKSGKAVNFDKTAMSIEGKSVRLAKNQILEVGKEKGVFTLANDDDMHVFGKNGKQLDFVGYYKGKKYERTFWIGHDCCHIELKKGNLNFIVGE